MKLSNAIKVAVALAVAAPAALADTNGPDANRLKNEAVRLGVLDCTIEGGFGLLLGSSRDADCRFTREDGTKEQYTGKLKKLGIDVGVTAENFMSWVVYTPKGNNPGDAPLTGNYTGFSADAALGIGLGANALIGGNAKNVGLQPLRIEGKRGLNLAVGLTSLELTKVDS
ncbi:DUF992 domain-containing protein [Pseudaestuariivita atlantica]|uniref:DUF992 domain-containing protein n=1 Tax=Pseudaestuariivita atlantica TaxID=1317121 RepID=A0A0L1JR21_9RHOB|nr:DUF992 domain-containing protein [Pseudaestuariivita atlantica]KNG94186.1 hypothetical protein ATO11_08155 [Pseudaestuariivita atlantica]